MLITRTERWTSDPARVTQAEADGPPDVIRLTLHGGAVFLVVLMVCLLSLALVPTLVGYGSVAVTSGSMRPSLRTGDIVVTADSKGVLAPGAVVDYETDGGPRIHRVVEVLTTGYRTKGDANRSPDQLIVPFDSVNGVGIMVVPLAGVPSWLSGDGRWLELGLLAFGMGLTTNMATVRWLVAPRRRSPSKLRGREL